MLDHGVHADIGKAEKLFGKIDLLRFDGDIERRAPKAIDCIIVGSLIQKKLDYLWHFPFDGFCKSSRPLAICDINISTFLHKE